jgi:hypothetical protein
MFRSRTIIRELVLNLAKVTLTLKPSVQLRRICYLVMWQHVTERRVCCTQHTRHSVQYKLPDDGRRPKHVGAVFVCTLM